jgi:SAM-dependent methyltransferase
LDKSSIVIGMIIEYILWFFVVLVFVSFTFVVFVGAPYLPTLKQNVGSALDLIGLESGQTLLELGSGNGRVMLEAASRGLIVVGIELNPFLVLASKWKLRKYRKTTKVIWGDFWRSNWPEVDGIFVFLLVPYMPKLDQEIQKRCKKGVKLVSFAFEIKDKKPTKSKKGIYLYQY